MTAKLTMWQKLKADHSVIPLHWQGISEVCEIPGLGAPKN